jgi:threonine synthase
LDDREVDRGECVVCITTGNGLKDPEIASKLGSPFETIDATMASVEASLGLVEGSMRITEVGHP